MKAAIFSSHDFDRAALTAANHRHAHELAFLTSPLDTTTASLARGYPAVVAFMNDRLDAETLEILSRDGTRLVALRSAGFNNILHRAGTGGARPPGVRAARRAA
jgi:D-lactate dehydrogenase